MKKFKAVKVEIYQPLPFEMDLKGLEAYMTIITMAMQAQAPAGVKIVKLTPITSDGKEAEVMGGTA